MSTLRAQIIKKNGKKEFAVLPYADFIKIQKDLEDYEDLRSLREAKESEKEAATVGLRDLKKNLARQGARRAKRIKAGR